MKSGLWVMTRRPSFNGRDDVDRQSKCPTNIDMSNSRASSRLTASFEFVGPAMDSLKARQCLNG